MFLAFRLELHQTMNSSIGIIKLVRTQNVLKNLHFLTHKCAYQGLRNESFLKNFACVLNEWTHQGTTIDDFKKYIDI